MSSNQLLSHSARICWNYALPELSPARCISTRIPLVLGMAATSDDSGRTFRLLLFTFHFSLLAAHRREVPLALAQTER